MIFKPFMREGFMPLPVAFISTISAAGVRNIAPYSCVIPVLRPLDLVCLASALRRDTLQKIRETGEFVVNLAGEEFADKVIPTARFTAAEIDEFELGGLAPKPSETIKAPGIVGCYAWMECTRHTEYEEADYILIVGRVLRLEVADRVLTVDHRLDLAKARPLMITGSAGGMHFCTAADIGRFEPFGAMFPGGTDPLGKRYAD
jgi:flavin reductase (DIM6/NTAB) family NADH-FMN oxidoreductase RutF